MPIEKHIKVKIALVGDKAVGKTSLIRRFVTDQFDDRYLLTLGTKVMRKVVPVPFAARELLVNVDMAIWDIMGQVGFREITKDAYFFGASGALAVIDLTRRDTLEGLEDWIAAVESVAGKVPVVLAVNKKDLVDEAAYRAEDIQAVANRIGCPHLMTSAKTGENVEVVFRALGARVAQRQLQIA
jgi:small GTP-binding protein